jgi:hypothetical protein
MISFTDLRLALISSPTISIILLPIHDVLLLLSYLIAFNYEVASQIPPTPFGKGGRGDFVPQSSVVSPLRAFRVSRSALFPKSLQPSVYLPE